MIEAVEVVGDVWVFHNSVSGRNWGVVLGVGRALLVDQGELGSELDASERFLSEQGREVEVLVFTRPPESDTLVEEHWPHSEYISPAEHRRRAALPASMPGWETIPLFSRGEDWLAVYHGEEKILFCGDMLSGEGIPHLSEGSQRYIDNLDKVQELDAKMVVPRFGTPVQGKRAVRERIDTERNYLYALRRHVAASLAAGATLERALDVARQIYEDFPHLEDHLHNMRLTWEELQEVEER